MTINVIQRSSLAISNDGYYDVGSFHRKVTTTSKTAQIWFDRGLIWVYAFNHEEAANCFEQAIKHDKNCPMAYWGLAYTLGPNYNKPWKSFGDDEKARTLIRIRDAVAQAESCSATASSVEKALISTLKYRYPDDEQPASELSIWNQQFAKAMQAVYSQFKDDLDVATLYTDSLMSLTPWKLWNLSTGAPAPGSRALEAKAVLDAAFTTEEGLRHPGLLHLNIHLMEMSSVPETALTLADRLRGLIPAGHLLHMPSHIYILCGDYRSAIASNAQAIAADEKFVGRDGGINFYTLYRCHNYHFLIYAAMFSGQSQLALDAVSQLEAVISEPVLRINSPPMADWLEGFLGTRVHVLIRFGRWDDLIALKLPQDVNLYAVTKAMIHYGKGIAYAATGLISEASAQQALFTAAVKNVPASRTLFNNTCIYILQIASAMLDGELAYRKRDYDSAFSYLRRSIHLDDNLEYDEPWGWMQPTRHAYGALLLEQGHIEDAAKVYSADLGMDNSLPRARRHLNNVWALHGYYECLIKLGRTAEAQIVKPQLDLALAVADVKIKSSCFCRLHGVRG